MWSDVSKSRQVEMIFSSNNLFDQNAKQTRKQNRKASTENKKRERTSKSNLKARVSWDSKKTRCEK